MKSKLTLLVLLAFFAASASNAQDTPAQDTTEQEQAVEAEAPPAPAPAPAPTQAPPIKRKKPLSDKVYFGGYMNLSFGKYTMIGVEPMIGYKLIPRLSVGAKIRYEYIQDKRYSETYTASNYGASVFTRLMLFRGLYAHAEYAGYNYKNYYETGGSQREWIPFMFVGGGYNMRIGKRTSVHAQVLFDVLKNDKSPYKSWEPFYSVGVGVGF